MVEEVVMAKSPSVSHVSESFINPRYKADGRKQPYYLAPSDLAMLSAHYIQKGLVFTKPLSTYDQEFTMENFLEELKASLSLTLVDFYPLAGQLVTQIDKDRQTSLIFVDCDKGPGARFVYATLDMTFEDMISPTDVPLIVRALFDHDRSVNHDGHFRPLLSVQITELADGVFIGCSMNHAVADGTSYWNFWKTWSVVHKKLQSTLSDQPIHEKWFLKGCGPRVNLPFTNTNEFISRYEAPILRERIFHFSSEAISRLKIKANSEAGGTGLEISSLQALCALVWKSVTRARFLSGDQMTYCSMDANIRGRLDPPLPENYFGNLIWVAKAGARAGELLEQDLGWATLLLHKSVSELTDKQLRNVFEAWVKSPFVYQIGTFIDPNSVVIGSSPRFDVYGNDFGIGKPVAVRSGYANKFAEKVTVYPGRDGRGSMDLEICLPPDSMSALEVDDELMAVCY